MVAAWLGDGENFYLSVYVYRCCTWRGGKSTNDRFPLGSRPYVINVKETVGREFWVKRETKQTHFAFIDNVIADVKKRIGRN